MNKLFFAFFSLWQILTKILLINIGSEVILRKKSRFIQPPYIRYKDIEAHECNLG